MSEEISEVIYDAEGRMVGVRRHVENEPRGRLAESAGHPAASSLPADFEEELFFEVIEMRIREAAAGAYSVVNQALGQMNIPYRFRVEHHGPDTHVWVDPISQTAAAAAPEPLTGVPLKKGGFGFGRPQIGPGDRDAVPPPQHGG